MSLLWPCSSNNKANNPNCEFYLNNKIPGKSIYVKFYPKSAIFNGNGTESDTTRYSLQTRSGSCSRRGSPAEYDLWYLIGLDGYALENRGPHTGYFEVQSDPIGSQYHKWLLLGSDAAQNTDLDGLFGYGNYVLELKTWDADKLPDITDRKERRFHLQLLRDQIRQIIKDSNDIMTLEYFDIISWIDSKLLSKSFSDIIKSHSKIKLNDLKTGLVA